MMFRCARPKCGTTRSPSTFGRLFYHFYFCDLVFLRSGDEGGGRRQRRTLCSVVLLMASDDEPIFLLPRAHAPQATPP